MIAGGTVDAEIWVPRFASLLNRPVAEMFYALRDRLFDLSRRRLHPARQDRDLGRRCLGRHGALQQCQSRDQARLPAKADRLLSPALRAAQTAASPGAERA